MTGVVVAAAVLVGAGASTAAVPTAITGPVTAFGSTTATVSGTVNPGGQSTTWHVEYGTTTSYGSQTAGVNARRRDSQRRCFGLPDEPCPGDDLPLPDRRDQHRGDEPRRRRSLHHDRPAGRRHGCGDGRHDLGSDAERDRRPNGRATTWWFEYGTSTSYGSRTTARNAGSGSATDVSEAVSGLTAGRAYHFRLVAQSDAGTSRGADRTFLTSGVPGAVTDAATSIAPTSARLNGTVTPNGLATSWWFEYGTSTRYGSRTAVRSAGSGTRAVRVSIAISRLARTTTYHYRLVARNAAGTTVGADRVFSTSLAPASPRDEMRRTSARRPRR